MKTSNTKSFLPYVILIIGLVLVVAVFFLSVIPSFFPFGPIETVDDAKELSEQYLTRYYDDLEIKEIMEFSNNYYIIAMERNTGNGAVEILVDRSSGRVSLEPGPNMMWNTKYGHHSRLNEPTTVMPIDEEDATMTAQEWLNRNNPGYRVVETTIFYGYYTMDFGEKEEIIGMLSINGYSGDIWYHSWHGDFISMEEYD